MRRVHQVVLAVALALAAAGVSAIVTAGRGLITEHAAQLTIVSTAAGTAPKPGVVVAHGFAGSARLMQGFADTLARRGFVVAVLDFAGHGADTAPQSDTVAQVERAVAFLRTRPGVDAARISLIGHSMGAGAVTRYAAGDPLIDRTVAISLGSDAHLPGRLLVIVGGLEFSGFREVARSAGPERSLVVPGTEHISVLFAPRTHDAILAHLGAPAGPGPMPWLRLLGGGLLLLAFALGMYPLIRPSAPPVDARTDLLIAAPAGCAVAVLIGLLYPPDLLPLAVGGYVAVFAAAAGITMAVWAFLRRARPPMGRLRPVHFLFAGYAIAMTVIPIHFGLTHALPGGARWWLLPVVVAAFAILAYATLVVSGGRFLRIAAVSACVTVVLTAATIAGLAPGFLLLILPLLVLLLSWQAVWMAMLSRTATPVWVIAVTGAVLPAWPAATTMPLL